MDFQKLERFLNYMQDKVEACYKFETNQAIERFLQDLKGSGKYD